MNENLDLTKILKDCPKGMLLDCEIFDGTITFSRIVNDKQYPIEIKIDDDYIEYLNKYGGYVDRSFCKCVIFPKGKTTWEGFKRPFVDGDVIVGEDYIGLYETYRKGNFITHCSIDKKLNFILGEVYYCFGVERLATEKEKQKLFKAIQENGYKWNAETKTLDKLIVPKFKVGDKVRNKANVRMTGTIIALYKEVYEVKSPLGNEFSIDFISQDRFELAPNKFDPKTLQPFDKVLTRDLEEHSWDACIYSHMNGNEYYPFTASLIKWRYCIPYNDDTKHLIGKTDEAPELYRYWEE